MKIEQKQIFPGLVSHLRKQEWISVVEQRNLLFHEYLPGDDCRIFI